MSFQTVTRSDWTWNHIRPVAFWVTTFVVVFELAAGSVWNLMTIEWIEVQMRHVGYPYYFAYISGVWQAAAAVAIIAPRFPLLKEWAYAGIFFLWSGAAASHLSAGDSPETWGAPLMFLTFGIASWALRPTDRRLPGTRFGQDGASHTRPRAWAIPIGILAVLYVVSFLTLPAVEDVLHERAVELGWIGE